MANPYASLPRETIAIDAGNSQGPYEWWRHTIGHGGINSLPLPGRVIEGAKKLKPRLVRTFIQQYFDIYPEHGRFDWTRLDPYMDALAATGAKVVAAITIKPKPLFPHIDQYDVMPNDGQEWQHVIYQLVKRYSVDKPIVTYWEVGNEPDIGENGGCPFYFRTAEQYNAFYRLTVEPILAACPQAKVGGPALADASSEIMKGLIGYCRENAVQLDFVSWHLYNDDPLLHKGWVEKIKGYLIESGITPRPEMLITEWNKMFDPVSIEELAYAPERAAMTAAGIMAMTDAGLDYSFYYHVWDQANFIDEFGKFFADVSIMTKHWNEVPHRFGLFGVEGEARPQYFVYRMFSRMGEERVPARWGDDRLWVQSARGQGKVSVIAANYSAGAVYGSDSGSDSSQDMIVELEFSGLAPGRQMLTVYRIDDKRSWSTRELELIPVERREIDSPGKFACQVYSPRDSVTMAVLTAL